LDYTPTQVTSECDRKCFPYETATPCQLGAKPGSVTFQLLMMTRDSYISVLLIIAAICNA